LSEVVGSDEGPEASRTQHAVDAAFSSAARRWEWITGVVRIVASVALYVRSVLIWNWSAPDPDRAALTAPVFTVTSLYILGVIGVARSRAPIERVLRISVALDSIYAFSLLVVDVVWPWRDYPGIANTPDIAALAMVTLAAGLRLSPSAALLGGVLNSACFCALLTLDASLSHLPPAGERVSQYALQATFLLAAVVLALIIAVRTRDLVHRAVRAALTAERVRRSFGAILHEHHDVRTLISAARLNADRLAARGAVEAGPLVSDLRNDLDDVEVQLDAIRARAYGELLTLEARRAVDIGEVAGEVVGRVGRRFPAIVLTLRVDERVEAEVAGGAAILRRLLFNLVSNACEGDGERGAAHVDVAVRGDRTCDRVQIEIIDDGPGFPGDVLHAQHGETCSTKVDGSGLGLAIARTLVQASDGTLTRANRITGGATVSLTLPMAPTRPSIQRPSR
jgi:signal transduction histidine kinase